MTLEETCFGINGQKLVGWRLNRQMSRDDRPNPNDNRYVEMRFIGSLWKGKWWPGWKVPAQALVGLLGRRKSQDQETHNTVQHISQTWKLNKERPDVCFTVPQI